MKIAACLALLICATPAASDVLALVDYDALFTAPDATLRTLEDGSTVLTLPHDVEVMRSDDQYTSVDLGRTGAVGCFVKILSDASALAAACDAPFTSDELERLALMRDQVLPFYADNISRNLSDVRAQFDALVTAEEDFAVNYCAPDSGPVTFMRSVLAEQSLGVVEQMIETPRFPASHPCL